MTRLILASLLFAGCAATVRTEPTYATHEPAYREPVRRAPHQPPPQRDDRRDSRWVTIADRYSANNDRQFIAVNGEFRRLRVEAVRGAPVIHKVAIEFQNDSNVQVFDINARMRDGQGQNIDLNGGVRQVRRIVVYTEPGQGGAYSIYGA
jgi:hypothetical protein